MNCKFMLKSFFTETFVHRRRRDFSIMGTTTRGLILEGLSFQYYEPRRVFGRPRQEVKRRRDWTLCLSVSPPAIIKNLSVDCWPSKINSDIFYMHIEAFVLLFITLDLPETVVKDWETFYYFYLLITYFMTLYHSNRELLSHENVTFNNNGTLSTIPHHPLEWRGELSEGRSEDDILYLPNIALLVSKWITHPAQWIRRISKEFFSEKTPERWNRTREM